MVTVNSAIQSTLGSRLKKARSRKNLTQEKLAEIIGIKQQAIQRIEAGKVQNTCYSVQIAVALDVTPEWLILGHGNPTDRNPINLAQEKAVLEAQPTGVPLLDWDDLDGMIEPSIIKESKKRFPTIHTSETNCYALEVRDNSMQGSQPYPVQFSKGDVLIVKAKAKPKSGDVVVARIGTSPHACFRVYSLEGDNTPELKAINPQYSTIKVTPDIRICGVVYTRYSFLH